MRHYRLARCIVIGLAGYVLAAAGCVTHHRVITMDMPPEAALARIEERAAEKGFAPAPVPDRDRFSMRFESGEFYRDVSDAAWSPDSQWVAEVGGDLVQIWDPLSKTIVHSLRDSVRRFHSVHFGLSRDTVLVSAHDGSVIRWEVATGKQEVLISGDPGRDPSDPRRAGELHSRWIVDLSPDGVHAILVDYRLPAVQPVFAVWDLRAGTVVHTFEAGNHAAFSPDGAYVAVTMDLRAIVWDVKARAQVAMTGRHLGLVANLAWTSDSRLVTNDNKSLYWWHPGTGQLLESLDLDLVLAAVVSPRAQYVVLLKPNTHGGVRVGFNMRLVDLTTELKGDAEDQIRSSAFRGRVPTAEETAAFGGAPRRTLDEVPVFEVWGRLSKNYGFPVEPMIRFSPHGELMLIREQKDQLHLWSTQSQREFGYLRPAPSERTITVHVHGHNGGSVVHVEDVNPNEFDLFVPDEAAETYAVKTLTGEPWSFQSLSVHGGLNTTPGDSGWEVGSILRNGRRLWEPGRAGASAGWEHAIGVSGGLGFDAGTAGAALRLELTLTHEAGQARRPAPTLRIPGRHRIVTDLGIGTLLGSRQGLDMTLSSRFDPWGGLYARAGYQWHPESGIYYTVGVQSGFVANKWVALGLLGASVGAAAVATTLAP